jgi:hypothetical protein
MANPVAEAAVEAVELDAFAKDIPDLIPHDKTLYTLFKNKATTIPIAVTTAAGGVTRPSFRIPFRAQAGAALAQGTGNADSMGRGTGSQWAGFALSPVFVFSVCEITFLARIATEGRKRGLFNVQAQELKNTFQQATQGVEALLQGDGSGTLDQIPTTATVNNNTGTGQSASSIVGLNNAFAFTDQQTVQVFPSIGGSVRGSFVISYVDPVAQAIYSAGALPSGTTTGDYLIVAGASGAAGGSIMGLRAWQLNSNSGTLAGISRASYPGRLSTPTINLNGSAISTMTPLRARALFLRALGKDQNPAESGTWYCGVDQAMQISALWYNMLSARTEGSAKGELTPDVTHKNWPDSWGGFGLRVGMVAQPGRLDLFSPATWYLGELLAMELYDYGGGMTVMPVPDIVNGGYLTSSMFAYVCALNIGNANVRGGVYIQNASVPAI